MPDTVLPSLDATQIFGALADVAGRSATAVRPVKIGSLPGTEERWALASALALRHTALRPVKSEGDGSRVLPFPVAVRRQTDGRGDAPKAPVVSLALAKGAALRDQRVDPDGTAAQASASAGSDGALRIVPAPGSVSGLDEGRFRLTVFQALDDGYVLGREVAAGARIVVSRRSPTTGDVTVYATRRTVGLFPHVGPPRGARIVGVVEAVIP